MTMDPNLESDANLESGADNPSFAGRDVKLYDIISAALFAKDTVLNGAVQRIQDAILAKPDVVLRALGLQHGPCPVFESMGWHR